MITASKEQQNFLLKLSEFDLQISRSVLTSKQLESNPKLDELRKLGLELSEGLLSANARVEKLQGDLNKVLADVELVDRRMEQDELKAKSVSSERELKAIESELDSLKARKSALEDTELELLQEIESAEAEVGTLSLQRTELASQLDSETAALRDQIKTIVANAGELREKRQDLALKLNSELLRSYEAKAARGVAVGQTLGRDCSACRLAINGVEFDAMMALPEDALPTCPNCDAFIIR